ncbi:hypothetical protein HK096_000005 [Nowakowskiella sp. JEL0078]|nr:hypothetical protein HK096_000005 [Nowakowskiella sp. JEL0078]
MVRPEGSTQLRDLPKSYLSVDNLEMFMRSAAVRPNKLLLVIADLKRLRNGGLPLYEATGPGADTTTVSNELSGEAGDVSASGPAKRTQSPHSSSGKKSPGAAKGGRGGNGAKTKVSGGPSQDLRMLAASRLKELQKDAECYRSIKSNPGNMTKGTTGETLDGRFKFSPSRRVMIPKPGKSELRPLSIGAPREKIIQKALQVLLEVIFDPQFLDCSHGFRPGRSVFSALKFLYLRGARFKWVVQGDISKCFDRIPHDVIMGGLTEKISCDRTLSLIRQHLKVGYIDPENKKWVKQDVGTPQGSILSPLLSNIALHLLDVHLEEVVKPSFERGKTSKANTLYNKLMVLKYKASDEGTRRDLRKRLRVIPSKDPMDSSFRRMLYLRYADDFIILVNAPYSEAVQLRQRVATFLGDTCGLELNMEKTIINSVREGFFFLGAFCRSLSRDVYLVRSVRRFVDGSTRVVKGRITPRLFVSAPIRKIILKLLEKGFVKRQANGDIVPTAFRKLIPVDTFNILAFYNSKVKGMLNYYSFAGNYSSLVKVVWLFKQSCALTLALKFKLKTARKAYGKFGRNLKDPVTKATFYEPKTYRVKHNYPESQIPQFDELMNSVWVGSLTQSNAFKTCALCGTSSDVEMHHVRSVQDVRTKYRNSTLSYNQWVGGYKRKQIPLCKYHHGLLHKGLLTHPDLMHIAKYTRRNNDDNDVPPSKLTTPMRDLSLPPWRAV